MNSGVEMPGTCMEPLVGTTVTVADRDFTGLVIVVEVGDPTFAY